MIQRPGLSGNSLTSAENAMPESSDLKLSGVLAPITPGNCRDEVPAGAGGVEVRADLFDSRDESLALVSALAQEFAVLVTPRHLSQGGSWNWSEEERASYCIDALERGASMVDVEHGTEAAAILQASGGKVLLSWHDFEGMIGADDLDELTSEMESCEPAAIKVVPTARRLADTVLMLEWVASRPQQAPARIGFAMGAHGIPGRILSLSRGAPWTYGANGPAVAPGQLPVQEMLELYRVCQLDSETRVYGVAGNPVGHSLSPHMHNPSLSSAGLNAVYLPFHLDDFSELEGCWESLRLDGLSVTIPFKADALARADEACEQADSCGAANTLLRCEDELGGWSLRGFNTDFNGVLEPLQGRLSELGGVEVAVVGNGGAARGAVRALLEAGARPTIYYRSEESGGPVAQDLGVDSGPIDGLKAGGQRVVINATPLGLEPGDPSPVAESVFDSATIAFDMVYDPPETQFLLDARSRGSETIGGDEMLVAQGLVQFELFTGMKATKEDFQRNLWDARGAGRS